MKSGNTKDSGQVRTDAPRPRSGLGCALRGHSAREHRDRGPPSLRDAKYGGASFAPCLARRLRRLGPMRLRAHGDGRGGG